MTQPVKEDAVKVFISYSHKDWKNNEVGALVQWLDKQEGIEVISDHRYQHRPPEQGWQAWMLHSIEDADIVLCVCGEVYKAAAEKKGGGPGAIWEGGIITDDLYSSRGWNDKFYPVLPKPGDHDVVPKLLKPWDNGIALDETEKILRLIQSDKAPAAQPADRTRTSAQPASSFFHGSTFNAGRDVNYGQNITIINR